MLAGLALVAITGWLAVRLALFGLLQFGFTFGWGLLAKILGALMLVVVGKRVLDSWRARDGRSS